MHGHGYGDAEGQDGRDAVAGQLGGQLGEPVIVKIWICGFVSSKICGFVDLKICVVHPIYLEIEDEVGPSRHGHPAT